MPSSSTQPVLSLQTLVFGYHPNRPVIDGVTADLVAGKIYALIGPNAAGKSTLLRLMLGHAVPWSGTVNLGGAPVHQIPAAQRATRISFVPQRGSVSFAFTVRQVVEMGRFALPHSDQAVNNALDACDLVDVADQIYAELSVGQQQRVLVARAFAQSSDDGGGGGVMLMDEPASAMDLWHLHHTMNLLRRRAAAGAAVLVVLHDLNLAARYADVIWLMNHGKLVAAGPWDQVLRPQILQPVYRVKLNALTFAPTGGPADSPNRPVFVVDASDKI